MHRLALATANGQSVGVGDDAVKRHLGGRVKLAADRYETCAGLADPHQEWLSAGYLQPSAEDLGLADAEIWHFLSSGRGVLVVPMHEIGPVARPLLETLTPVMRPQDITVIDDASDAEAVATVKRFEGVRLVRRDEVLDCLDWTRLLRVLNLKQRPKGKGVTVLAGYLYQYLLARRGRQEPRWLMQHDAEIREYFRYDGMRHLVWGLLQRPRAVAVKMAKFGRSNEKCMLARGMLEVLRTSRTLSPAVRRRVATLSRLERHKWMLTGEFGLRWDLAMRRPFATGYLEETLYSAYLEDGLASRSRQFSNGELIQVANPNPRLDGDNEPRKEDVMQQTISNFLLLLALETPPVHRWTLSDIATINRQVLRQLRFGRIVDGDEGPVKAEAVHSDRIIPSVQQLDRHGFIDYRKVGQVLDAESTPF